MKNKRIRVVDCENKVGSWYANSIGKEYEVLSESPYHYYVHGGGAIKKHDAEVITDKPIESNPSFINVIANLARKVTELERKLDDNVTLDERTQPTAIPQYLTFDIAGTKYTVKEVDGLRSKYNLYGQVTYYDGRIEVDSNMSNDKTNEVIIHELLHAMLHAAGYDDQDEELVRRLGTVLYSTLKTNNFSFLKGGEGE